ncbi:MAG: DUF4124 domain-containing protein [Porticoccaceae bacterium]|nr:DUF4124 domain-containing protein [Porticoccaceae bacterium]
MKAITAILMLATAGLWVMCASAEVYKVVDPKTGKVLYTDTPPANYKPSDSVKLPPVNTQPATDIPEKSPATDAEPAPIRYETLAILQPRDDVTIPPGQLDVVVQTKAEPELQEGHLIRILFNNEPVASPSSTSSVVIGNLNRGSHQIQAQIIDAEGKILISSKTIIIHVKRASVKN